MKRKEQIGQRARNCQEDQRSGKKRDKNPGGEKGRIRRTFRILKSRRRKTGKKPSDFTEEKNKIEKRTEPHQYKDEPAQRQKEDHRRDGK